MKRITLFAVGCLAMILVGAVVFAQDNAKPAAKATKAAKPMMAMYLVESPHTEEECLKVMDEVNTSKDLGKWEWGCMAGNHTAYRMVQATDETAALAMVPEDIRAKAHAYKLMKMTPAQLASAHKHM